MYSFYKKSLYPIASLLLIISSISTYATSEKEWSVAMNVSGRQRMLTQKMAKEFALVLLNENSDKNKKNMEGTIDLFEKSLENLLVGNSGLTIPAVPNDKIKKQLNKVKSMWGSYKSDLLSYDKSKLDSIMTNSLSILKEMNKGVKLYEISSIKAGIKGKGKVINIAGRQRMLSQKMSKEAFFIALGYKVDKTKKDLAKTIKLFDSSLKALISGDKKMRIPAAAEANVQSQLKVVQGIWSEFKPSVDAVAGGSKGDLSTLANKNIPLLKEMHKAVGMFE